MPESTDQPKQLPELLTLFVSACAFYMTGEQFNDCKQRAYRDSTGRTYPDAPRAVTPVVAHLVEWILDDPDVAAWYGHERNEAVDALKKQREMTRDALRAFTDDRGDYSLYGELQLAKRRVESVIDTYVQKVNALRLAAEGRACRSYTAEAKEAETLTELGIIAGDFELAKKLEALVLGYESPEHNYTISMLDLMSYWRSLRAKVASK